jgi:hypothetical protein
VIVSTACPRVGNDSSLDDLDRVIEDHGQPPVPRCDLDNPQLGSLGYRLVFATSLYLDSKLGKEFDERLVNQSHALGPTSFALEA